MGKKYNSFVERLLDADNCENIVLESGDGQSMELKQIAILGYDGVQYCILKPVVPMEGMGEDDAIVFEIDVENDDIVVVMDLDIIDAVFEVYNNML